MQLILWMRHSSGIRHCGSRRCSSERRHCDLMHLTRLSFGAVCQRHLKQQMLPESGLIAVEQLLRLLPPLRNNRRSILDLQLELHFQLHAAAAR